MNITYRNHYLPQFYLRSFVNKDNEDSFWVYYKDKKEPIKQTPINTGVEKNLYNIKMSDGSIDDTFERKFLSDIEGRVSPIICRLINSETSIQKHEIPELALFLSLLAARVPRSIGMAKEICELNNLYILKKFTQNPREIQKFIDSEKITNNSYKESTIQDIQNKLKDFENRIHIKVNKKYATLLSISLFLELYYIFSKMNWCLCNSTKNIFFISSDCPVVSFVPSENGTALLGCGYGLQNVEISFPLSPQKCLLLDNIRKQKHRTVSDIFVKEINKRTAWTAEKFIISNIKCRYVEYLVNWSSDSKKHSKIDKKKFFDLLDKTNFYNQIKNNNL